MLLFLLALKITTTAEKEQFLWTAIGHIQWPAAACTCTKQWQRIFALQFSGCLRMWLWEICCLQFVVAAEKLAFGSSTANFHVWDNGSLNKLKWPPRLLWCTTSQQATDNAVIHSKSTWESQRRFGCPVPTVSLTGITLLQLKGRPGPQSFVCKAVTCPRHCCCISSWCAQDSGPALALCTLPVAVLVYWCLTQADIQLPSHMFTYKFCDGCSRGYGGALS